MVTTHGLFNYIIQDATEIASWQTVETLSYEADPLVNCTIPYLTLQFSVTAAFEVSNWYRRVGMRSLM